VFPILTLNRRKIGIVKLSFMNYGRFYGGLDVTLQTFLNILEYIKIIYFHIKNILKSIETYNRSELVKTNF